MKYDTGDGIQLVNKQNAIKHEVITVSEACFP